MGQFKELAINKMENPFYDVPDISVGISCLGNKLLRAYILKNGEVGICHYSGKQELAISLKSILSEIYDIICYFFTDPANEAGWDSHFDDTVGFVKLGGGYIVPNSKTHYENTESLIGEEGLSITNSKLSDDIIRYLPDNLWVEKDLYGLNDAEINDIDWAEISRKSHEWRKKKLTYSQIPPADRTRLFNMLVVM